ncbi:short chain dehydrogenase family protein [Mycobacterium kansasii 732]|nr:short chain dehydrogenase family protein [Mycobacterium kansasii 732]
MNLAARTVANSFEKAVAQAGTRLANPARLSDPDKLRGAVSGKTVLVTGASYGIGEATARKLAAAGATVLIVARSADRLDDVAAAINAGGGAAVAYPADLTDEAAVSVLTKHINENHGPLDIVVSNAGKSLRRSLHDQYDRPHDFQRTIDINYLGPIWLLLGLLPAMREAGRGHIVNVSSVGVRVVPGPQWAPTRHPREPSTAGCAAFHRSCTSTVWR